MINYLLKLLNKSQKGRLFIDVYKEYVEKYLNENGFVDGTRQRYDAYFRNLHLFLATNRLQKIGIDQIRISHMEEFRSWLFINLTTCTKRHASRQIELCQRVVKYAVKMDYCIQDHITSIKPERNSKKQIVYLETNEIKKLMVYEFKSDIYRAVVDLFLFQCFTGLSYADIWKYEIVDRGGKLWLKGNRQKTNEENDIYFFKEAREIWLKYQGSLPHVPNQTCNRVLKEVAGLLHITKKITTHTGRKTHATLLAEKGVGIKPISMQLGNTIRVCEDDYVGNSYKIIENEFARLGVKESLI